jgi:hypothetical protein
MPRRHAHWRNSSMRWNAERRQIEARMQTEALAAVRPA